MERMSAASNSEARIIGGKKHYRGLIVHDFRRSAIRNMTLASLRTSL